MTRALLHVVIAGGPVVALGAGVPQGLTPPLWLMLVVLVVGCGFALAPELQTGTLVMVLVLGWWAVAADGTLPVTSIAAAAALLASHLAATLTGYGPAAVPLDPQLLRLWLRRGLLAWLVAPVTWLASSVYDGHAAPASIWVAGLAAALGLAVVAGLTFPTRLDRVGHGD